MCGICGLINSNQRDIDSEELLSMTRILAHRGPDDEGTFIDKNVGLGVRRLKVIDLETGHQPIHNEDESIWIVFNGEIYNYKELRQKLEKRGHSFYTKTDTEVIIHLYEEKGADCVLDLNGMFAFCLWDKRKKTLILARDRLGIKPLYYSSLNEGFIFASEIKSILKIPGFNRSLDWQALDDYLSYLYIPEPRTIFKQIKKLPPGYILTYREGKVEIFSYWDFEYKDAQQEKEEYFCERLEDLLTTSIKRRLMSDVPLGVFLSGGLDSSILVGLMSQIGLKEIKTFSLGFDTPSYNELAFAKRVAEHFNTKHREFMVRPDAVHLLPKMINYLDEPFADSSIIPTFLISQLAKREITVALAGGGGDELFGGYLWTAREESLNRYRQLPLFMKRTLRKFFNSDNSFKRGDDLKSKISRFLEDTTSSALEGYKRRVSCFSDALKDRLYSLELRENIKDTEEADILKQYYERYKSERPINKMLYTDTRMYLPGDELTKIDRMSMANSLEVRVPFLDHEIVEFAATIPLKYKIRGGITKYIEKKAFRRLLPPQILRQRKHGFSIPIHQWFRGELKGFADEILLSKNLEKRKLFNPQIIQQLLEEHQSGRQNLGHHIWALLVFELWAERYLDGR